MPLTNGINHVALVTKDLDALVDFYVSVFDAEVVADMMEGEVRHAVVQVGAGAALHAFFLGDNPHAAADAKVFDRGHVDHVAFDVGDRATFELLRSRLVERGASDGLVTDFGSVRTASFVDPDGWDCEIALWQDGPVLTFADRIQEEYAAL